MGTSTRNRRGQSEYDPVGLAGWLYTDLLLGLMIVFLGSVTFQVAASSGGQDGSVAGGVAATTSTTSTTSTSTSTSTSTPTTSTTTTSTTTTSTTTTTTTIPAATTTVPLGVEKGYYCFRINRTLDVNDPESIRASVGHLRNELLLAGIAHRNAGIVLTFGVHDNIGSGGRLATRFNETVLPLIPMFDTATTRGFGDGSAKPGEWMTSSGKNVLETVYGGVRIDIYLFATGDAVPQQPDDSPDCG